jgi:hypothetical protein
MQIRALVAVILCLTAGVAAGATPAKDTRADQFRRLPNWTGLWVTSIWQVGLSGRPAGGEQELRANLHLLKSPPYNAEWNSRYLAGVQDKTMMEARNATIKACTRSFPALMEAPWQFQVATLPEETLVVFENGQVRHVYTDGRAHPSGDDIWPTSLGDSIGHWEGDTLVIDTVARDASEPLAPRAWVSMLSDRAHFTERVRLVDANTLEDQLRIDDPVAFTHPWDITLRYSRVTEMNRMIPMNCTDNDRNPVVDGKIIITP